jgi:hypothetical protein
MAMRSLLSMVLAFLVSVSVLFLTPGGVAYASFHCVRIHAVAGGFNGNNKIQYVELRMDVGEQTLLAGHAIQFFDPTGTLQATFTFPLGTFPFGASVANGAVGDSVLIATSEFNSNVAGGAADFTFSGANTTGADPLHPVQAPGGSVVWAGPNAACATLMAPVDSVAYGSATATYGTAAAALPSPGTFQALRLSNLNIAPSNNSTEYALMNVSTSTFSVPMTNLATDFTTPRNNSRTMLKLNVAAPPSVGGVTEDPGLSAAPDATARAGASGQPWDAYAIAAGAVAAALACGAGWYVYRRPAL